MCAPQKPIIKELEREYGGDVMFILIDVDEGATAVREYGALNESIQWAIDNHVTRV